MDDKVPVGVEHLKTWKIPAGKITTVYANALTAEWYAVGLEHARERILHLAELPSGEASTADDEEYLRSLEKLLGESRLNDFIVTARRRADELTDAYRTMHAAHANGLEVD
jgi:hypothetical protein